MSLTHVPLAFVMLIACIMTGCGSSGDDDPVPDPGPAPTPARMDLLSVRTDPSESSIQIRFRLFDGEGEPVAGRSSESFRITENGALISAYESWPRIIKHQVYLRQVNVLCLDLSRSVLLVPEEVQALKDAAKAYVNKLYEQAAIQAGGDEEGAESVRVAIYRFSADLDLVTTFSSDRAALLAAIDGVDDVPNPWPTTTNLHGALVQSNTIVNQERTRIENTEGFLTLGSVVLFTDGRDQAGVPETQALTVINQEQAKQEGNRFFTVGKGLEYDPGALNRLGPDGAFEASDRDELDQVFEQVASAVSRSTAGFYNLNYLSPKRHGSDHELTVSATVAGETTSITTTFNASQFQEPLFVADHIDGTLRTSPLQHGDPVVVRWQTAEFFHQSTPLLRYGKKTAADGFVEEGVIEADAIVFDADHEWHYSATLPTLPPDDYVVEAVALENDQEQQSTGLIFLRIDPATGGGSPAPTPPSFGFSNTFEDGELSPVRVTINPTAPTWEVTTALAASGTQAMRSEAITHTEDARAGLAIDHTAPSVLSFKLLISSESGFDHFRLYINGVEALRRSGVTTDWESIQVDIPAGQNLIEFSYSKDGSVSHGLDAAFIDDLSVAEAL